jgi:hypothetical protein
LALVLGKVSSPNRQRSLGLGRGKRAISSTSFVDCTTYALASRLRASWMEARVTKVARLSVRFSKSMEAYHIDRFGGVDGIVLRSSADPRPGPKEILMRVARAR